MDNFTSKYFLVPIRMYNPTDVEDVIKSDKNMGIDSPLEYIVGYKAILPSDISSWYDYFEKGRSRDDVYDNGFDSTIIVVGNISVECDWPRHEFEERLDDFMRNQS